MSNNTEEQMVDNTETKPKIMTGYVHYNKSDDLAQLFETLNEFRKNNGLKYSHQGNVGMVFFNVNSEHLDALYKVRPFKISKFQTRSEYECDKDTSDKLMGQKDSFVRMNWDEQTNTLTFMSRTTSRVHGNLVRRIFKDSELNLDKSQYKVLRDYTNTNNEDQEGENTQTQPVQQEQNSRQSYNNRPRQTGFSKQTRQYQQVEETSVPEGFQRVSRKPKNNTEQRNFTQNDSRQRYSAQNDSRQRDPTQNDSRQRYSAQRDPAQRDSTQNDSRQRYSAQRDSTQRDSTQRDSANQSREIKSTTKVVREPREPRESTESTESAKPKVRGSKVPRNNV